MSDREHNLSFFTLPLGNKTSVEALDSLYWSKELAGELEYTFAASALYRPLDMAYYLGYDTANSKLCSVSCSAHVVTPIASLTTISLYSI